MKGTYKRKLDLKIVQIDVNQLLGNYLNFRERNR